MSNLILSDLSRFVELTGDTMTGALTINTNSTTALLVEQDGVKDNVLVVDTTNGRVGINKTPTLGALDITGGVFSTSQNKVDGTANEIQLIVQGHSTQTTNLQEWQNSSATVLDSINGLGQLTISPTITQTTTDDQGVLFSAVVSAPAGTARRYSGAYGSLRLANGSGNSTTRQLIGSAGYFQNDSAATVDIGIGIYGRIWATRASGVITNASSLYADVPSITAGSITTLNGLYISNQGHASVTNAYGIYVASQSSAVTLNYAIYTNAGAVRLGDTINSEIGQTSVNGLTGTAVWSQSFQGGSYKKFLVYLTNFTSAGTVITFPTAFAKTPYVYGDAAAIAIAVTTTTTCTLTSVGAVAGMILIEGY